VGAADEKAAQSMKDEFEKMKANGKFDQVVAEMRLE
jgi:hypothetical protein